jgi:hypothetical protein
MGRICTESASFVATRTYTCSPRPTVQRKRGLERETRVRDIQIQDVMMRCEPPISKEERRRTSTRSNENLHPVRYTHTFNVEVGQFDLGSHFARTGRDAVHKRGNHQSKAGDESKVHRWGTLGEMTSGCGVRGCDILGRHPGIDDFRCRSSKRLFPPSLLGVGR